MIPLSDISAVILAGGKGSRMGGVDKGLQSFNGTPLALHTMLRLQMQAGGPLAQVMVNANRNLAAYEAFGASVWPDVLADYAGPLAGFLTGLERCESPYLATVPCDTPLFPLDLLARLATAVDEQAADIAMVNAPETGRDGKNALRPQPVFCLMKVGLLESLAEFVHGGGRKIDAWTAQHKTVLVPFDLQGDDPRAFFNANTLAELQSLQASSG
jgi:molybdopterin-guanine dinucleotide biosynthesis protein A